MFSNGKLIEQPFSFELEKRTAERAVPLLYIDVNLGAGRTGRIGIYKGDDPQVLAKNFSTTYQLEPALEEKLVLLLQQHVSQIAGTPSGSPVEPPDMFSDDEAQEHRRDQESDGELKGAWGNQDREDGGSEGEDDHREQVDYTEEGGNFEDDEHLYSSYGERHGQVPNDDYSDDGYEDDYPDRVRPMSSKDLLVNLRNKYA